jgi:tRNA-modifying protein YgfZ
MSDAYANVLTDRGIVEVAGPDAASFLQGLVTNDVSKVTTQKSVYAALLAPQGKIIYDFLIVAAPNGFFLDCVRTYAADIAERLKKYKLRAKVTVTDRSNELAVIALSPGGPDFPAVVDPRLPQLGRRAILPSTQVEPDLASTGYDLRPPNEYLDRRLALGVPDSATDIPPETLFPLDCNFEELNGVDFTKGCYVGQELTARMKHRATARKRLLPVSAEAPLPQAGTPLRLDGADIGELRGTFATRGMALIRLDRLGNTAEAMADGVRVKIGRPAYPLIIATEEHQ